MKKLIGLRKRISNQKKKKIKENTIDYSCDFQVCACNSTQENQVWLRTVKRRVFESYHTNYNINGFESMSTFEVFQVS